MQKILVPTDFSNVADNALNYALQMAREYHFALHLFHSLSPAAILGDHPELTTNIDVPLRENQEKLNAKIRHLHENHPEVRIEGSVELGGFADVLDQMIQKTEPLFVMMGITGDGEHLSDKIIGSNTINAMQNISTPIIIVPKNGKYESIRNICLACDLKDVLLNTPPLTLKVLIKLFGARLHILNINKENMGYQPETQTEIDYLNEMLDDADHAFHFIQDDDLRNGIDQFVKEKEMNMLIVIPKQHSLLERIFSKSQSENIAYHSHIPVLSIRRFGE